MTIAPVANKGAERFLIKCVVASGRDAAVYGKTAGLCTKGVEISLVVRGVLISPLGA